jgi:hypothetical protein
MPDRSSPQPQPGTDMVGCPKCGRVWAAAHAPIVCPRVLDRDCTHEHT